MPAPDVLVHPFSVREYLRHRGAEPAAPCADLSSAARVWLTKHFRDDLGHLEDAFLIRTVSLHTASERQRMVNPRKA